MRIHALILSRLLSVCIGQPEQWSWQHADSHYSRKNSERDIYGCGEAAKEQAMDGALHELSNARGYGGWGNFDFEFCMEERGWKLTFVESLHEEPTYR